MVFGAGPIGIGLWFALRGKGIEDTFVVEPSATRRAAIETLGARTLDPAAIDVRTWGTTTRLNTCIGRSPSRRGCSTFTATF